MPSHPPRTGDRQCWGRHGAFYYKRCQRRVSTFYCADHRPQWLALPALAQISTFAIVSDVGQVAGFFTGESQALIQLKRDAYTKVSLIAHSWKIAYFSVHPQGVNVAQLKDDADTRNIWKVLIESEPPTFNRENWVRYHPLFTTQIEDVRRELQAAQAAYSDVLDPGLRSIMERTASQLQATGSGYLFIASGELKEYTAKTYQHLFVEVFTVLGELDTEARRLRADL